MEFIEAVLLTIITASTPLLLAASGELVVERAGVLNLGVEGMMIVGAACGFGGAYLTGSIPVGALCGILGGIALAAGLSRLDGWLSVQHDGAAHLYIPYLTDIPFLGRVLLGQNAFVYFSIALIIAIWFFLYRTRAGLVLRAVGDNHTSAHALGYPVLKIRLLAVLFGGACAGLGGAFLPLAYTPFFIPGMTAGRGWIALALVVFASWRPLRLVGGAYLFGAVTILQLHAQGAGWGIPSQFISALPYLATGIVLF